MSREKFTFNVRFSSAIEKLMKIADVKNYRELAEFLGLGSSSITNAKIKDKIPWAWLIITAKKTGVTLDDLDKLLASQEGQPKEQYPVKAIPDEAVPAPAPCPEERRSQIALREAINEIMSGHRAVMVVQDLLSASLIDVRIVMIRQFMANQGYLQKNT